MTIVFTISGRAPRARVPAASGVTLGTAIALLGAVTAAQAQTADSGASSGGLQEVVVTAQRRSENIQNVPIAVTAFTAETLKAKGITDIHGLSNLTPNVNLDAGAPFSADSSVLSASIRGIGQDDFAFNLDPGVGVYLDGVYLARTIGANQNLLDVDRIEILKGPQGTLFGRNTIGGAISIVTHTPGTESRFLAEATTGRFNRRDFAFTADMPITDTLLSSVTVSSQVRDGYQKVIPYPVDSVYGQTPFTVQQQSDFPKSGFGSSDSNGGQNVQIVRTKLLWNQSDKFNLMFSGDWSHENQSAQPVTVMSVNGGALFATLYNTCIGNSVADLNDPDSGLGPVFLAPTVLSTTKGVCGPIATGSGLSRGAPALAGAGYVGGPAGPFNAATAGAGYQGSPSPQLYWNYAATHTGNIDTTYANGPSFARYDQFGGSVTGDWTVFDETHLKSITGYRQIAWITGTDLDGTPATIQEVTDHQHQYQASQEFQLSGKAFDDKLDYVGGLYYFHEAGYVHDYVPFTGGILYVYDAANDVDTKSYAGYIHADYKVTDRFGVTVGERISHEKKDFVGGQEDLNASSYKFAGCYPVTPACTNLVGFPDVNQPLRYFPAGTQEQTYNISTPTLGVQYHLTNDIMAYASWSKGFKSGGWTTRLSAPILNGSQALFGPEYDKTTEFGVKSEWLDHHLLANAAVFYSKYSGIQLNFQEGASPVLHNAGNATLKGGELEVQSIIGNGLSFNFAGGYIDAYYTFIEPDVGIPLDSRLPKTPKYKTTFGPQYDFGLPNSASMRFNVDFTYTADMFNDSLNTPELRRPASRNLNAAVHYLSPTGLYEVVFGGDNLTDDRYIVVGSTNGAAGEIDGTYNAPREWYLSLKLTLGK